MIMAAAWASGPGCTLLDPNPDAVIEGGLTKGPVEISGKRMYLDNCVACHGLDGISIESTVTNMKGWTKLPLNTYGKFDSALTNGPGAMPKFDTLDQTERQMIFQYLDSL